MPLIKQSPAPEGGAVLARLHAINAEYGYLPEEALRAAAEELHVPLSQVYGAASFYAAFSFEPRGRHTIQVCQGTACYIRGGDKILDKLESALGVRPGETTATAASRWRRFIASARAVWPRSCGWMGILTGVSSRTRWSEF